MTSSPLRLGGVAEHFNLPWHLAMESADLETGLADLGASWEDQPWEPAEEWFGTTSFAPRRAMDPRIATEVLDALSGAGLR